MLLAVVIFSLPYAVKLQPVQDALKQNLITRLDIEADISGLKWQWLPSPRIVLFDVTLKNEDMNVSFPYGAVATDFARSIRWRPGVKLILDKPEIDIQTLARTGTRDEKENAVRKSLPPFISLEIKKGHLLLPADGFLEKFATRKSETEISDINADIAISPDGFDLKSTCRLAFADKILAHVRLDRNRSHNLSQTANTWHLDIRGENIDLTGMREKVLTLFGGHRVARKICAIVRGGRVKNGGYLFDGPVEDFHNLASMKILARADGVNIQVPKIGLQLENGKGPVTIEDGVLSGQDLSARVESSTGRDGSITLDLLGRNHNIKLDVDVDADAKELRDWLMNNILARHEAVVAELGKITRVRGRVKGKLHIGDNLHHPVVKAEVTDSDSMIDYERFDNPIRFKKGRLSFYPDKMTWDKINGRIGSQQVVDSRGTVAWNDIVRLDVDNLSAHLDTGTLLQESLVRQALEKSGPVLVDSAGGRLDIEQAEIHGPVNDFKELTYDFKVSTDELTIDSPRLPDVVRIKTSGARISNSRIELPTSRMDLSGRQISLEMNLSHSLWRDFSGSLTVNGLMGEKIAQWVKKKGWVPARFFPKVPCYVDPLTVSWNQKEKSVKGKIIPGHSPNNVVSSRLDLNLSEDRLDLKTLSITSVDETADMSFHLDRGRHPSLKAAFDGSLKKETLDVLLENNQFLTGTISGDCEMAFSLNHDAAHRMTGDLDVSWAVLFLKDNRIVIDNAAISGEKAGFKINRANLKINDESVIIDGRVHFPDETDVKTELNVTSGKLSLANLQHLSTDLKNAMLDPESLSSPSEHGFSASGIINFDIKQFIYNPEQVDPKVPVRRFVGHDFSGTINLEPGQGIVVSLLSGDVCGVQASGKIGIPPVKTSLTFQTDPKHKPEVQELLDCLGIKDREVSGKYVLDAAINGTPGNWTDGFIKFKARKGRLKGLVVISKILTLLNVTEFFSINVIKNFFTMGYPYKEMKVSGKIADNILTIDETQILGEGLDIFFKGTVDLTTTTLDMVAYVKPFKMVDSIVTLIPYVGKTLGDGEKSIAYIPFKIKGTLENPDVFLIFEDKNREKQ